jgi:hypothetical protein
VSGSATLAVHKCNPHQNNKVGYISFENADNLYAFTTIQEISSGVFELNVVRSEGFGLGGNIERKVV